MNITIVKLEPDTPESKEHQQRMESMLSNTRSYAREHGLRSTEGLIIDEVPTSTTEDD